MSDGQFERVKAAQEGVTEMPAGEDTSKAGAFELQDGGIAEGGTVKRIPIRESVEQPVPYPDEGLKTVYIKPGTPEHEAIQQAAREAGLGKIEPAPAAPEPAESELNEIIKEMAEAGPSVDPNPTGFFEAVREPEPGPAPQPDVTELGRAALDTLESGEERDEDKRFQTLYESVQDVTDPATGITYSRDDIIENIKQFREVIKTGNLNEAERFLRVIPRQYRSKVRTLTNFQEFREKTARQLLDEAYGEQAA